MIDRFERFSAAISGISRYWHKLAADEMKKYGLKGTHAVYLVTLSKYPEGIPAPEICELCGRDKSDVSRMMSILEKKGMVVKESVNRSLYRGVFRLTEKGKAAAEHVRGSAVRAVAFAGKDLTEQTRNIFYEALESVAFNLCELCKEGIPES